MDTNKLLDILEVSSSNVSNNLKTNMKPDNCSKTPDQNGGNNTDQTLLQEIRSSKKEILQNMQTLSTTVAAHSSILNSPSFLALLDAGNNIGKKVSASKKLQKPKVKTEGNDIDKVNEEMPAKRKLFPSQGARKSSKYYMNIDPLHYAQYDDMTPEEDISREVRMLFRPPISMSLSQVQRAVAAYIFGDNKDNEKDGKEELVRTNTTYGHRSTLKTLVPRGLVTSEAMVLEEMLLHESFYEYDFTEKPIVTDFIIEAPDVGQQYPRSNDCGVWVAKWMSDCQYCSDYNIKLLDFTGRVW